MPSAAVLWAARFLGAWESLRSRKHLIGWPWGDQRCLGSVLWHIARTPVNNTVSAIPAQVMDSLGMSLFLWSPKRKRERRGRRVETKTRHERMGERGCPYLGRLANLLADSLPLVVLVLLDGIEKSSALRKHCQHPGRVHKRKGSTEFDGNPSFVDSYLVFGELCIVHVLSQCQ